MRDIIILQVSDIVLATVFICTASVIHKPLTSFQITNTLQYMKLDDSTKTNLCNGFFFATDIITCYFIVSIANKASIVHTVICNYFGTFANFLYTCPFVTAVVFKQFNMNHFFWIKLMSTGVSRYDRNKIERCTQMLVLVVTSLFRRSYYHVSVITWNAVRITGPLGKRMFIIYHLTACFNKC